ncbi:MAG: beta-galactosidase trimerization domain-containing protein [Armatimonadota bacterium]
MTRAYRAGLITVACASFLALTRNGAALGQSAEGWADKWSRFVILVWQYKTPPPGPEAKAAYKSVNLRGIHLDNRFSDALLNFARQNDYNYYVDHTAGKGYLYLRRDEWKTFSDAYKANRKRPVRPRCLRDPKVMQAMKDLIRGNVTRARTGPVVGYAFDDEISVTSFTNPADLCWSAACLAAFREWLKGQYGTIDRLNAEWDTRLASFDEAEPLHVDDLRSVHELPFDQWNLARWADHRSFMDTTFADVLADLTKYANSLDPSVPAGFVGGQAPSPYGGYDYAKLCEAVQWMEAYDIGCSNEIVRSFFGQSKPHVQTHFSAYHPNSDKWFLWYYLVHGNRGVICWPDRNGKPWFEGGTARPEIRAMAGTYEELQGPLGQIFVNAELVHDGIAIYYSQPSIQVSWFMDIKPHGGTWVNRSSSLNSDNATDIINRWAWVKLLEDCGLQYEFVSHRDVADGQLANDEYGVLLLPRVLAMSDAEAATIRRFVENGGTVIADYLVGVFDEHGKARPKGALDDMFGVAHDFSKGVLDGEHIAEVNGERYNRPLQERLNHDGALRFDELVLYERGLRATTGNPVTQVGGAAAIVQNEVGQGTALYGNLTPIAYLLARFGPGGDSYRRAFTAQMGQAGVKPRVRVFEGETELPNVERLIWQKDGQFYLCLIWNALRNSSIDGVGLDRSVIDGPARTITVRLSGPAQSIRNLRTGKSLGPGTEFQDTWLPCEANVYQVQP